jgi:signal transduction histidine kinase
MSHDLRTPLNAIGGYAELLTMSIHGPVTDEQAAALGRIQRAQQHLLTLINDILSFAKLEAGQVQISPSQVLVRSVIEELSGMSAPQARMSGLEIHFDPGPEGLVVRADRARLIQILLNLTSNAFKFTEAGRVDVRAVATDGSVQFHVSDTGRGIPAEKFSKIFDPFVQARRGPEEDKGGAGLGLAISRELARLMDGTLTVISEEGRGSTFTLELPRG